MQDRHHNALLIITSSPAFPVICQKAAHFMRDPHGAELLPSYEYVHMMCLQDSTHMDKNMIAMISG